MPTTSTASTPASATRWRRTGCSRWRWPAARCSGRSPRCSAPSMSPTTPRPAPTSTRRRSAPRSRRCRRSSATSCAATRPATTSGWPRSWPTRPRSCRSEFAEFGFEPTAWTDFDVAMIYVGTMAGRFSHYSNELNNAKVLDALVAQHGEAQGRQLFDQIFWIEDPLAPTTVPAGEQYQKKAEAPAPARRHPLRRPRRPAPAGQRGRPPARQQPLDPRAGEDHRRQHHPRQRPAVRQLQPGLRLLHRPARRRLRHHRQHALRGAEHPLRHQRRHRLGRHRRAARRQRLRRARAQPGEPAPVPPAATAGPTCGSARRRSRSRAPTT